MTIPTSSVNVNTTHLTGWWNHLIHMTEPCILKDLFHFLFILMLPLFKVEGEENKHLPLLSP